MRREILLLILMLAGCGSPDEANPPDRVAIPAPASPAVMPRWRLRPGDVLEVRLESRVTWPKFNVKSAIPPRSARVDGEATLTVLIMEPGDVAFCELRIPVVRKRDDEGGPARFDSAHEQVWREPMVMAWLPAKGGLEVAIDTGLFPAAVVDFVRALELALPPLEPNLGVGAGICDEKATGTSIHWLFEEFQATDRIVAKQQFRKDGLRASVADDVPDSKELNEELMRNDSPWRHGWRGVVPENCVATCVESSGNFVFSRSSGVMEKGERTVFVDWKQGSEFILRSRQGLSIEVKVRTMGSRAASEVPSVDAK